MKFVRATFFIPLLLFITTACSFGKHYAPKDLKGQTVYYYTTHSEEPCDQNIVHKTLTYIFNEDGTYTSTFHGDLYERGNYSYGKAGRNEAQVTMSYTKSKINTRNSKELADPEEMIYTYIMIFKSPSFGTWQTTYVDNDSSLANEYGTFQIKVNSSN